ncbi:MAG: ABC transporter ATP-binding protein [Asticcacaulis sp.]
MSKPVVMELRGLVRRYPSGETMLEVLRGIDLRLHAGEIIGLIGPSGSGKSSLLHAAGLLETPDGGAVILGDTDYSQATDAVRTRARLNRLGFVYQFHHLLPEYSALDNVALPLRIAGRPETECRARARDLLCRMRLEPRLNHQPAQMSGGEQQRVAIARALVGRPMVLLADEPTGNLDPDTSAVVFELLRSLARDENVACLIATHNIALAEQMDRVVTLRGGKLDDWTPIKAG